ncbi:MAG TPA: hypothetical protein VJQ54_21765, partial [Candidatus Sulfotelmatobacter sp.]|nr:hypothetical protein [Candidatus Sulfotelmatobacter sp.]
GFPRVRDAAPQMAAAQFPPALDLRAHCSRWSGYWRSATGELFGFTAVAPAVLPGIAGADELSKYHHFSCETFELTLSSARV